METTSSQSKLRPMTAEQSLLSKCDGSVSFNQGDTSVLVAVYGPADVKMNREIIDKATVDVIYKPKSGLPGCAEKFQEKLIRSTCESVILSTLHPRTAISVILQEMQNYGSFLACCINGSCLALLDAAVPMKYMVASVSCIIDPEGQIILDPSAKQEVDAVAQMTFAFEGMEHKVITISTSGRFSEKQFQECLSACREGSKEIFAFYRDAMRRKLSRSVLKGQSNSVTSLQTQ